MGYLSLWQPEKQKDSPAWGCSHFYTAGTWCMWWCSAAYAIYQKFGMMRMTSCPGQQPLVESLWWLLCQPIAAIVQQLGGRNQGPVGLDYRCTGDSGAQRSGFLFTITHAHPLDILTPRRDPEPEMHTPGRDKGPEMHTPWKGSGTRHTRFPLWTEWLTDTCENITLLFLAVTSHQSNLSLHDIYFL